MSFRPTHRLFADHLQLTRPSRAPHMLLLCLLFIPLALPTAASADSPRCPYPLCTSDSCSYAARPDPQTAYTHNNFESGYRPKDFTLFKVGSWYHLIYILQYGNSDTSATRFGHARSKDLNNWSILPAVLPVSSEYWDNLHVWAPSVIARGDAYYLFYTGVSTSGKQSIGLATSTDLVDWTRLAAPILTCEAVGWALCDSSSGYGRDFRDPFVMQNPADTSEWLMYYTTRAADSTFVPGLAVSDGDFTSWTDKGPLWRHLTNWWNFGTLLESPHLFGHGGTWFVFYTTDAGQQLEFQTSSAPADTGTAWTYWNRLANLDCIDSATMQASEYFADPTVGPAGREYFCNCTTNSIEIRQIDWWGSGSPYFSLRTPTEVVPPSPVTDLRVTFGVSTATLSWTAPGADSSVGTAAYYTLRYSTDSLSAANFAGLDSLTTSAPSSAGTLECLELSGLASCDTFYFALVSTDSSGNRSGLSNVVSGRTRCSGSTEVACAEGMFLQVGEASAMSFENAVLMDASSDSLRSDMYPLRYAGDSLPDELHVRLTQRGPGAMALESASLLLVDPPSLGQNFVADGQGVVCGTVSSAASIQDELGHEVSQLSASSRGICFASAGSTFKVALGPSTSQADALLFDVEGGASLVKSTGIEVQVLSASGEWAPLHTVHPRPFPSSRLVGTTGATDVRLLFHDEYVVRRIARVDNLRGMTGTTALPSSALLLSQRAPATPVSLGTGASVLVQNGQCLALTFPVSVSTRSLRPDAYLQLSGRRVEAEAEVVTQHVVEENVLPIHFALHPITPNPFRESASISFSLPWAAGTYLDIFDANGRRVRSLVRRVLGPGLVSILWDRRDDSGGVVPPGVYICRLRAGDLQSQRKLILLH